MRKTLILLTVLSIPVAAQETPHRTWATLGATLTKSTAEDSAPVIVGTDVRLAYDLRRGFQARAGGEYRKSPTINRLFTAYQNLEAKSEIRYEGALLYHFPAERKIRPLVGGGVFVTRHFFNNVEQRPGTSLYNSSVNPYVVAGAGIGRKNELTVTRYLADTYSYSNLRGWSVDFTRTQRLSGRLHLRSGVRARFWSFRDGHREKQPIETSIFFGFHFQ